MCLDTYWYRSTALTAAATCAGRAARHRRRIGSRRAVVHGRRSGVFGGEGLGGKTGEDDREDRGLDEKFHDLVTFGGLSLRFVVGGEVSISV